MASLLPPKKPPLLKQDGKCPPPLPQEHHSDVLRVVVIVMACMAGMLMFLCTVSVLIRYFNSRRYSRNNQNRRDTPILFDVRGDSPSSDDVDDEELEIVHPIWYIRTVGLQQSLIDSITVFKYKKDDGIIDGSECSVCLGEFEHDESLRLLPKCSHAFHIPCIDTWLRSHKNCPLCRAPVVRDVTDIRAVDQNNNNNINRTDRNVSDDQSENEAAGVENSDEERIEEYDCSSGITVEEETRPLRRAVSVDSFSASMFRDVVVDLDTHNHVGEKVNSRGKDNNKGVSVGKNGSSSSSSSFYKVGSSGLVMQKRTVSTRRSFSHNRKFLFSRHFRSQSSTLPL